MDYRKETYDFICFSELAYEWDFSAKKNVEIKIRERLKLLNKEYNQSKIDYIRSLRNDLFNEISLSIQSKYFTKSNLEEYADLADFDIKQMLTDFKMKYDKISDEDLLNIIEFAGYLFYMR